MKFKIGDWVQVVNMDGMTKGKNRVGEEGNIVEIAEEGKYPIRVKIEERDICPFDESELEHKRYKQLTIE